MKGSGIRSEQSDQASLNLTQQFIPKKVINQSFTDNKSTYYPKDTSLDQKFLFKKNFISKYQPSPIPFNNPLSQAQKVNTSNQSNNSSNKIKNGRHLKEHQLHPIQNPPMVALGINPATLKQTTQQKVNAYRGQNNQSVESDNAYPSTAMVPGHGQEHRLHRMSTQR